MIRGGEGGNGVCWSLHLAWDRRSGDSAGRNAVTGTGRRRPWYLAAAAILLAGGLAACTGSKQGSSNSPASASSTGEAGIHKIKHVIIIMQENRSFDNYFGTYPGADGIPMTNGAPAVCAPNPKGPCIRPYHDTADINGGGPHGLANAIADEAGGKMNGFVRERAKGSARCLNVDDPACNA